MTMASVFDATGKCKVLIQKDSPLFNKAFLDGSEFLPDSVIKAFYMVFMHEYLHVRHGEVWHEPESVISSNGEIYFLRGSMGIGAYVTCISGVKDDGTYIYRRTGAFGSIEESLLLSLQRELLQDAGVSEKIKQILGMYKDPEDYFEQVSTAMRYLFERLGCSSAENVMKMLNKGALSIIKTLAERLPDNFSHHVVNIPNRNFIVVMIKEDKNDMNYSPEENEINNKVKEIQACQLLFALSGALVRGVTNEGLREFIDTFFVGVSGDKNQNLHSTLVGQHPRESKISSVGSSLIKREVAKLRRRDFEIARMFPEKKRKI